LVIALNPPGEEQKAVIVRSIQLHPVYRKSQMIDA
jgi:hypothetical protein